MIHSGATGVTWNTNKKGWVATMCFGGEQMTLGIRKNKRYAVELRKRAERLLAPLHKEQEKLIAKQLKALKRDLKKNKRVSLSAQIREENALAKQA